MIQTLACITLIVATLYAQTAPERDQPKPTVTIEARFLTAEVSDLRQLGLLPPESSGGFLAFPPSELVQRGFSPPPKPEPQTAALSVPPALVKFLTESPRLTVLGTHVGSTAQLQDGSLKVDVGAPQVMPDRSVALRVVVTVSARVVRSSVQETRVAEGESMFVTDVSGDPGSRANVIVITPRLVWPEAKTDR
jgi:hypothetical protein